MDLDGVVADFYGGLRPIAAEWLGVDLDTLPERVSWGLIEWGVDRAPGGYEALHKFAVMQRELFLKLPPMHGAPQTLRKLSKEGVRIRIITHRLFIKYFHQIAVSQTIQWLDRHDIPYWDLCFMQQKTAVGADLYIEDSPENVERLRAEGREQSSFRIRPMSTWPPRGLGRGKKCSKWSWPRKMPGKAALSEALRSLLPLFGLARPCRPSTNYSELSLTFYWTHKYHPDKLERVLGRWGRRCRFDGEPANYGFIRFTGSAVLVLEG